MGTFVAAYLIVWLAVALYVLRLGAGQRRLRQTIEALQWRLDRCEDPEDQASRAA